MPGAIETADPAAQCLALIREQSGVSIYEFRTELTATTLLLSGRIGSWHGKQLASEAARGCTLVTRSTTNCA